MNLGPSRYAGGLFFSPPQIAKILGKCVKEIYSLIDDGILKGRRRKLVNKRAYQIHVDNLLNFLEDHPDKWDSRNVPVHVFGIEPDWMKEKRKKDMKVPTHVETKSEALYFYRMVLLLQAQIIREY